MPSTSGLTRDIRSHHCALCNQTTQVRTLNVVPLKGFAVVECTQCRLVFTIAWPDSNGYHLQSARAIDAHPEEAAAAEYWSPETIKSELRFQSFYDQEAAGYLDLLATFVREGRLLDVGCSFGAFLTQARGRGYEVTGVEGSAAAAAFGRERFGLDIRPGTLDAAGLSDGAFAIVTVLDVIEHQLDPAPLILQVQRVLRPGGVVLIETPNHDSAYASFYTAYNRVNNVLGRLTAGGWNKPWDGYYAYDRAHVWQEGHVVHFTSDTLTAFMQRFAFESLALNRQFTNTQYLLARQPAANRFRKVAISVASAAARALGSPNKLVGLFRKRAENTPPGSVRSISVP